jgi:bone morphogenetic protein 7
LKYESILEKYLRINLLNTLIVHHKAPHLRHDKDRRFWFDVSEVSPEENIMDAELRLFRDLSHNTLPSNLTYQLTLYSLSQGDDPE